MIGAMEPLLIAGGIVVLAVFALLAVVARKGRPFAAGDVFRASRWSRARYSRPWASRFGNRAIQSWMAACNAWAPLGSGNAGEGDCAWPPAADISSHMRETANKYRFRCMVPSLLLQVHCVG